MPSVAEWWQHETFIPLDWSPPTPPAAPPRRRWSRWVPILAVTALAAVAVYLGWLAWKEQRTAQREQALVQLQTAELRTLSSEVTAKGQLLSSTNSVAGELQACIDATNKASSDFFGFLNGSQDKAASVCHTAESDYQQLLSSTGSPR